MDQYTESVWPRRGSRKTGIDSNMSVNILCMKWGTLYGAHYVNRLYDAVDRNLSLNFRFVCFTDDTEGVNPRVDCRPLPEIELPSGEQDRRWMKLGVFQNKIATLSGPCLFLDLDVVIVETIDELFEYAPGEFCISHDWWMPHKHLISNMLNRPKVGNTSIFRFEAGTLDRIPHHFENNMETVLKEFTLEQAYITSQVEDSIRWWPERWVRSFRRHCRPTFPLNLVLAPRVPDGVKVIAFHGQPKLDKAAEGYISRYPHKICRPSKWIREHWG